MSRDSSGYRACHANSREIHVMTDRALRGLASIRPKSLAEAEGLPGIGPVKLHAVVPRSLEAIAKWEKNGN